MSNFPFSKWPWGRKKATPPPLPEALHVIVFSRDRACQLDLLFSSMKRFLKEWRNQRVSVLYCATNPAYEAGYERVKQLHPEFRYLQEAEFKRDLVRLFDEGRRPCTSFLVDDDIFIDDLSLDSEEFRTFYADRRLLCLSCRMCPRLDYFYVKNLEVPPPRFRAGRTWRWKGLRGDWGYPMSVSGLHIFRSVDLAQGIRAGEYRNPNTFEKYGLVAHTPRRPLMVCFEEAKVFCVAVNRVQTVNQNRSADTYPVEELNTRFLSGHRLSCAGHHRIRMRSAHGEIAYEWQEPSPGGIVLSGR